MTNDGPLLLVIEDEVQVRKFLRASLRAQSFRVMEAETIREARLAVTTSSPDLLLLDLGLPDGDGLQLVSELREWNPVPVIVISARGRESEKVQALDAGADDYLTKPFGVNELLARIRAALRHSSRSGSRGVEPVIRIGPLCIDLEKRMVERNGVEVHLTPTEYRLLVLLARDVRQGPDPPSNPAESVGPGVCRTCALRPCAHGRAAQEDRRRPSPPQVARNGARGRLPVAGASVLTNS